MDIVLHLDDGTGKYVVRVPVKQYRPGPDDVQWDPYVSTHALKDAVREAQTMLIEGLASETLTLRHNEQEER